MPKSATADRAAVSEIKVASTTPPAKKGSVASLFTDAKLIQWNILLLAISPLWMTMKVRRWLKKRSNHEFNPRRWTVPSEDTAEALAMQSEKTGPHVVFVGASFGEILLVDRVCNELMQARPDLKITWAIRDPHTIAELKRNRPDQRLAVWPFDSIFPVSKWLKRYSPDLIVFAERYSFPNLVAGSNNWGSKVALVNGRSKGTVSKFSFVSNAYYRWIFGCFDAMCFQSDLYADRVKSAIQPGTKLEVTGNLKLDLVRKEIDPERATLVTEWLKPSESLPILCAGSTNNRDEEKFVLEAFEIVRKKMPCRLLLAPRKMIRVPDVLKLLSERGHSVSQRSKMDPVADVMLLDTIGELAYSYQFCQAAYVGGALNGMGHNVAEPVEWGIPVSYGPRRGHFEELQKSCERAGVGFRISKPEQLAEHWLKVLSDAGFRQELHDKAISMLESQRGAVDRTAKVLLELLEK